MLADNVGPYGNIMVNSYKCRISASRRHTLQSKLKLCKNQTSSCEYNTITIIQKYIFSGFLPSAYMPGKLTSLRSGLDDAGQSGKMAPLFNPVFVVFKCRGSLPNMSNIMIILYNFAVVLNVFIAGYWLNLNFKNLF